MTKRILASLIALLLITLALASVAEAPDTLTTFPIVQEPLELTFATWFHPVTGDYNDLMVWDVYEEMTNIKINWIQIPRDSFPERRNLMFATNDLPDAFFKGNLSNNQIVEYAKEGYLVPLNDLIEAGNAPNVSAVFEQEPAMRRAVTQQDGNIYTLGYFNDCSSLLVGLRMFLNEKWMENVGAEVPATLDEFLDLLRAFRDSDANGNGDPGDEIPYGGHGVGTLMYPLAGAFSLYNRGSTNEHFDVGDDGNIRFVPTAEGYRELLGCMATMYEEGLIDREIVTLTIETNIANASSNRYGVISGSNSQIAGDYEDDYFGLPAALIGPNGSQMYTQVNAKCIAAGCFTITNKNQYPEETLRWVDYFYSLPGSELFLLGVKGETYDTDENGNNYYLDWVLNDPDGRTFDQMVGTFTAWGGGGNPVLLTDNTFLGGESQPIPRAAAQAMVPYLPEETWEAFTFTDEESELLATLGNDITSYITEMRAQFITGKASLESDWDSYVAEFDKMNLDDYVAVYQAAYERELAK